MQTPVPIQLACESGTALKIDFVSGPQEGSVGKAICRQTSQPKFQPQDPLWYVYLPHPILRKIK